MRVLAASANRQSLARVLAASELAPELSVEGVGDAETLLARLTQPDAIDLLLIDFDLPGLAGLRGVQLVRAALGDRPVGVLLCGASLEISKRIIDAGAQGVLTREMGTEAIAAAITLRATGHTLAVIDRSAPLDGHRRAGQLSERELQVVTGLCDGLQNKEIAHSFDIQEVTVKMHVRAIIRKLGARNRTHAAMIARDLGIC